MDLTQLANLGEFIGGVAVLVTLVYLAVQVRESTAAQRTAAELATADVAYKTADGYSRFCQMLADEGLAEIWAKAQRDAELSATDEVRLRAMVSELTYASVALRSSVRINLYNEVDVRIVRNGTHFVEFVLDLDHADDLAVVDHEVHRRVLTHAPSIVRHLSAPFCE